MKTLVGKPMDEPQLRRWPQIDKAPSAITHYLCDYQTARNEFSWSVIRQQLGIGADDRCNIAALAVDRHASTMPAKSAATFIDRDFTAQSFTYAQLSHRTNRFANVLTALGIDRGAIVTSLLGRCPELFVTALGTLKFGGVFSPLFTAFGPEPIRSRVELSGAEVLVTTAAYYERKVSMIRASLPKLRHVLILGSDAKPPNTLSFDTLMSDAANEFAVAPTRVDDPALLHFTSGTTGKPKGVLHMHGAVIAHYASARLALDLHAEDIYWCTADPGWVTGISYGLIAPLVCGCSMIVDREELDVERWYRLLAEHKVSVWYTAPTAIRMLMKAGIEPTRNYQYPALRHIASVGEPLNPEAVMWGVEAFKLPVHDTWWQTETGAIMIANYAACPVLPGSMGRALPGIEARIAHRKQDGSVQLVTDCDEVGEIVIRSGWPSMFRAYLNDPDRYCAAFSNDWYFAGDLAKLDKDGNFWFVGRSDDVIKSAGHLISPFEVECAMNMHPAVNQAAVIGLPDAIAGQVIKAIVELKPGMTADENLKKQLIAHGRKLLGAAMAPRDVGFTPSLPRTRSGKIMRRLLRARELGLPEGDLSTLEPST